MGGNRAGPAWVLASRPAEATEKALREGVRRAGKRRPRVRHSGAQPPLPQAPNSALLHSVLSIQSRSPTAPLSNRGLPEGGHLAGPHSAPPRVFSRRTMSPKKGKGSLGKRAPQEAGAAATSGPAAVSLPLDPSSHAPVGPKLQMSPPRPAIPSPAPAAAGPQVLRPGLPTPKARGAQT